MKRRYCALFGLIFVVLSGLCPQTFAHELQPSSLALKQLSGERYELIWRAPIYYNEPHPAKLQLPEHWQMLVEPTVRQLPDSAVHRYLVTVPDGGMDGSMIRFIGLEATITDVFARITWLDGTQTTAMARPGKPWLEIVTELSAWQVAGDYTILGVDHILFGFDHLSFVLALLLLVQGTKRLVITVTSFTLAHSITLAGATLGVARLPGPPVEATIALSILFLASELVRVNRGRASLTAQYPWVVAFVFGLLHGFGFAGALTEVGLPQNEVPLALLMFNVGVELGQLMFVAAILTLMAVMHRLRSHWPEWVRQLPAYGIGSVAAFWLIERLSSF